MFKKGFTIIEIMVVVAIIAVLVGVIAAAGNSAKKTARDNQRRTDISLLQIKLEAYRSDNNGLYPTSLDQLVPTYFTSATMPKDPLNQSDPTKIYMYDPLQFGPDATTCGVSYYLRADLEGNNSKYDANLVPNLSSKNPPLKSCGVIDYTASGYSPARGSQSYEVVSPETFQQ